MRQVRLTKAQERRLRQQLRQTRDARVHRRTLGVLEYGQGEPATHIARRLNVHRSEIHRWWNAYDQAHDPTVLCEGVRPGRPCLWTEECMEWLGALMASSPRDWGWPAVDWTATLLQVRVEMLAGRRFSQGTIRQALRELGYVWKRPRYVLPPDPEEEKKTPNCPSN